MFENIAQLLIILWFGSAIGAGLYAGFSKRLIPNEIFHPYKILKRETGDRIFTFIMFSLLSFLGPITWMYIIYMQHNKLKTMLKSFSAKDTKEIEKFIEKKIDCRHESVS